MSRAAPPAAEANGHERHRREGRRGREAEPVCRDAGNRRAAWFPPPIEIALIAARPLRFSGTPPLLRPTP